MSTASREVMPAGLFMLKIPDNVIIYIVSAEPRILNPKLLPLPMAAQILRDSI